MATLLALALLAGALPVPGLLAPAPAAAQQFPDDDGLRTMLRYLVEDSVVPGAVLGVLEPDGTTRVVAWGSAGPDGRPMEPGSLFEVGSLTKTFTATVLAEMARTGEVSLDDPVAAYLPDSVTVPRRGGEAVTLAGLATHTSGLPQQGHLARDIYDPYADFTLETLYTFLDTIELRDIPGHRYRYSNVGMSLLAHALERAAGVPYPELLRERVLDPLGMDRTTYAPDAEAGARPVMPYDDRGAIGYRTLHPASRGQGGLFSTAEDLLRYLRAQVGPADTELERAMRETQTARVTTTDHSQGLGWHIAVLGDDTLVWHGGATGGATTQAIFSPRKRIGAVLLVNVGGYAGDLPLALVAQDPRPEEWRSVDVPRDRLRRLAGTYQAVEGDGRYFIRLDDDGLTFQPPGKARSRLYPTSDSTFYLLRGPWTFTFRATEGAAVEMRMAVDQREPGVSGVRHARKVDDATPPPVLAAGGSWYRPPRGPSPWSLVALALLVIGAVVLGPVRTRLRARRR